MLDRWYYIERILEYRLIDVEFWGISNRVMVFMGKGVPKWLWVNAFNIKI